MRVSDFPLFMLMLWLICLTLTLVCAETNTEKLEQVNDAPPIPVLNIEASNKTTNASGCANKTSCSSCTESNSCVWCQSSKECLKGSVWGPKGKILKGCSDWRWRQCKVNGKIVFWVSGAVIVLIVILGLVILLLCCCCCCRRTSAQRNNRWSMDAHEERYLTPAGRTQAHREYMANKYGTPQERERLAKAPINYDNNHRGW